MQRIRLNFFLLLWVLLLSSNSAFAATENYVFDPNHTSVLWHISHFGFSNPSGKWQANGTLIVDEAKPQEAKVNITIHMADIVTGIPELDKHLKSKLFFDAEQFPDATFVSNTIKVTGKNTAKMQGMLTVHGVSKPVTLNIKLNKEGINPITNKKTAGFTASTELKRSDFGISTLLPGLGDQVKIDIEAEAYKEN